MEKATEEVWLQQSDAHMKEVSLTSLQLGQAVGVLPESPCLIPSRPGTVPVPLLLAFTLSPQTSAGYVGHRDLQN